MKRSASSLKILGLPLPTLLLQAVVRLLEQLKENTLMVVLAYLFLETRYLASEIGHCDRTDLMEKKSTSLWRRKAKNTLSTWSGLSHYTRVFNHMSIKPALMTTNYRLSINCGLTIVTTNELE